MRKQLINSAIYLAAAAALSACGGGSGEDSVQGDAADAPLSTAPALVQKYAGAINAVRAVARSCGDTAAPAVPALTEWNPKLQAAAQAHAEDMNKNNYFDHVSLDGVTSYDRVVRQGYTGVLTGENLGKGTTDVNRLTQLWTASPGHCTALMSEHAHSLAIGQSGSYVVLMTGD